MVYTLGIKYMWNKPLDQLGITELEDLIRRRRGQTESPLPRRRQVSLDSKNGRRRNWWKKGLHLVEILGVIIFSRHRDFGPGLAGATAQIAHFIE